MKIELIERGGRYFLRKYWLGFIPKWWDDSYDGGWTLFRLPIELEKAKELMKIWENGGKQKAQFQANKDRLVKSIKI